MHTYLHAYMHVPSPQRPSPFRSTRMSGRRPQAHMHAYIHACTHTYIHACPGQQECRAGDHKRTRQAGTDPLHCRRRACREAGLEAGRSSSVAVHSALVSLHACLPTYLPTYLLTYLPTYLQVAVHSTLVGLLHAAVVVAVVQIVIVQIVIVQIVIIPPAQPSAYSTHDHR